MMDKFSKLPLPYFGLFSTLVLTLVLAGFHTSLDPADSGAIPVTGNLSPSKLIDIKAVTSRSTATTPSIMTKKTTSTPQASSTGDATTASGYTVKGNTIYDSAGKPHLFHGLDRPSLEWSSTGDHLSLADYKVMASWKANVIRLPLNQKYWLQNTDNYRATVDQQVQWINSLGMDVILDLHWSDKGDLANTADQQDMADSNSVLFWQAVANIYKSNPKVLFELYNEPRNISWDVWKNSGQANGFTAVGMQKLYNTVRATGANNLVIIGGTNWAYDLSQVSTYTITGTNIVYATHPYDYYGKNTAADWDKAFGTLSATAPVIMTEFGDFNCSTTLYSNLIDYAQKHTISWTAWGWFPGGCQFPALINDWSGEPNAVGQVVKNALASY